MDSDWNDYHLTEYDFAGNFDDDGSDWESASSSGEGEIIVGDGGGLISSVFYSSAEEAARELGITLPPELPPLSFGPDLDLLLARPSTIQLRHLALDIAAWSTRQQRARQRAAAAQRAPSLGDSFFSEIVHGLPPSLPLSGGGDDYDAVEIIPPAEWLEVFPVAFHMIGDLSAWLREACISVLPPDTLEEISFSVWCLLFATLGFPRMQVAFEGFIDAPTTSPEAARFRLAGVGPQGPPPPPGLPSMFAPWEAALFNLAADDVLDLESSASNLLHLLDPLVRWVLGTPVLDIPPDLLMGLSRSIWEAFIASLRIPQTRAQFETYCLDPPAFREISGLNMPSTEALPAAEVRHRRPHPRRDRRRARR